VHLVLHGGEELLGELAVGCVVDAGGVDVENLLIKAPLGGADGANALEQFVEVIGLARIGWFLEPLVVHGEALEQVFAESGGGPLPELGASVTAHPVTDSQNGLQSIVAQLTGDLASPFLANL